MATATAPFAKPALRVPPQDLSAEQALLGSIMVKPSGFNEIVTVIKADDFYAEKHRRIYQAMLKLFDKNEPIDLVSMTGVLQGAKQLESIGGAAYLAEIVNTVPSASNLAYYGAIVRRKAQLRHLIESAEHISQLGYDESQDIDNIFESAEKTILGIISFSKKSFTTLKESLAEAWERFERLHKSADSLRGVPTGFKQLDDKLAGLQKSDLIILAARPSMGKTSLALDIARQVVKQQIPVCVFSLEMSSQQLVDRLIAAESHVDSWKLRTGRLSMDDEFSRIRDALDVLSKAPLFIDDDASNNITKMKSVARRLKAEHNLGLIVVDYLQLMIPRRDSDSLVQQVTEI